MYSLAHPSVPRTSRHYRKDASSYMSHSSLDVYVATPYSLPTTRPRKVATWTPNKNWTWASQEQLFPEKFAVLVLKTTHFF